MHTKVQLPVSMKTCAAAFNTFSTTWQLAAHCTLLTATACLLQILVATSVTSAASLKLPVAASAMPTVIVYQVHEQESREHYKCMLQLRCQQDMVHAICSGAQHAC